VLLRPNRLEGRVMSTVTHFEKATRIVIRFSMLTEGSITQTVDQFSIRADHET
jgi:hypothetical protein